MLILSIDIVRTRRQHIFHLLLPANLGQFVLFPYAFFDRVKLCLLDLFSFLIVRSTHRIVLSLVNPSILDIPLTLLVLLIDLRMGRCNFVIKF